MKDKLLKVILAVTFTLECSLVNSQNSVSAIMLGKGFPDSLSLKGISIRKLQDRPDIRLDKDQSLIYLQARYKMYNWKNPEDPLRKAIGQLLFYASNEPYDSTRFFLKNYSYDSLNIPWEKFYVWDTIKFKMPGITGSTIRFPGDTVMKADTISGRNIIDSLKSTFPGNKPGSALPINRDLIRLNDTLILVAIDTLNEITSNSKSFPFHGYTWPFENDSIKAAINALISFINDKDSSIINISGSSKAVLPVWLNSKSDRLTRFWLRNGYSDSVTVWIGGVSRNTLGLFLEDGVLFRRPTKESKFSDARLNLKTINSNNLMQIANVPVSPHYWKLHSESSFIFNQTALTNWVRGGENSLAMSSDITGFADYNNKKLNLISNNFIRLKYGLLKSGEKPMRKNMDLLETNSKINHKAFGKFDFSAIMLFKTQVAKGYNYPNDSVPVSKFLNPAVLTFGLGLDYKPDKNTSINFSPLTYKGTFVNDTGSMAPHIDQTKYGIARSKKSLNEPGVSLMLTNEYRPFKALTITNRLQLFTNYIHNPQNIDVDWEMIATAKINWFTDIRFNTHLVFDDDTKTPVLDNDKKPVLGTDGKQKKTARIQFKELFGFSLIFRFY
jgi:hypothetical protein